MIMTTEAVTNNKQPPETLLITGGAGFIGSALVRYIIQHTNDSVINVDKITYAGNLNAVACVANNPRYHFEQADICNAAAMERVFTHYQPDAVMHLAAESHVDRSIAGPSDFIQTNIVGTYTLLEIARQYHKTHPNFRFHHISTDEVYGELPHTSDTLFTEHTCYAPSSPYSASKASADHLVRAWHRTYGLPTLISNCSNNYGPHQHPEKLIPLIIGNALAGKPLPIYGKGDQIRDWLYVEDHVRALHTVVKSGEIIGQTYNIGGDNEQTNLDVVKTICHLLDQKKPRQDGKSYITQINHIIDRPGHDRRYAIDASKIKRELGWRPTETFQTGLQKTIEWFLSRLD